VPLSVGQIFTQYLPCANHRARRERQRARVQMLHDAGLAATTYINPMLCARHPQYGEAVERGALSRNRDGGPYTYEFSVRRDTVSQFDFSAAAGRELFGRLVREALEDGHDGWMEDYGEYSPLDARSADGTPGRAMHNEYPTRYHCTTRDETRPGLIRYVRSGWIGTAPCAPVVWGGDPTTDWGYDGLASAVKNGLGMGLSGISTWGSDIGGFFALGTRSVTPELLKRWIQFGLVSGVMRAQETGIAVPEKDRPRVYEPEIVPVWRRYAKLRTQLHPYVAAADAEYQRSGLPIMRHLALDSPGDPAAASREDEFLFGPDLLAAPVIEPGARERRAYLPRGAWIDLWRAAGYVERSGALRLGRVRAVLPGRREAIVPAPLEELPLFVRAGAVLALLPADVETLSEHGSDAGIVHLRDRRDRMTLLAFPRGTTASEMNRRERLRSRERRGSWTLRIDGARRRTYSLQASLATLRRPLRPCRVTLDGRPLRRRAWRWDATRRVLRVRFATRRGALRVEGCGR
jgi:alpha-glucosidase (family GH31 glycosyl hydrolase)